MFDNHTHTRYSCDVPFEKGASVRQLCLAAINAGLTGLAVTDHFDIDGIRDGVFEPLDHEAIYREILEAKEEFRGKLTLCHGIELGQAVHMPRESEQQLNSCPYDIVLGSVHAVRGIYDFYGTDIASMSENEYTDLWERYLGELLETIKWGKFDILTHITYPKRYYLLNNIADFPDIKNKGREYFEPILKAVIDSGLTLECNTSGLRQPIGECLPNRELLSFYFELGGRDISLGSDAHYATDVGKGINEAAEMLQSIGFTHYTTFNSRKKSFNKF